MKKIFLIILICYFYSSEAQNYHSNFYYGSNYNDTQLAIFADHIQNLFTYSGKNMNNILDRCIVDGFVYTRYFRIQGKVNEFVDKMFSYALGRYIEKYDCIFYTNPYDVPLINDGERSMSESFRSQIINR